MSTIHEDLRRAAGPLIRLEDGWSRVYTLPRTFSGFAGHFPNYPLVPAVVQVRMALLLIADACGVEPVLRELVQAKFMAPLAPEDAVEVRAHAQSPHRAPFSTRWACTLFRNTDKAAQCQLSLEFPHAPN